MGLEDSRLACQISVPPRGGIGKTIRDGDDLPSWTAGRRDGCSKVPIDRTVNRYPSCYNESKDSNHSDAKAPAERLPSRFEGTGISHV